MFKPLLAFVAALAVSPAIAAAPEGRTTRAGANNDPNQVLCRQEREIGSMLRTHRICRTRGEWAQSRREMRREVERAQQEIQTSGQ